MIDRPGRPDDDAGILVISPVRNEAAHIEAVVNGVAAQERLPDEWVIVDDESTDGTSEILARVAADLPFVKVVRTPSRFTVDHGDRNLAGGPDRAWNFGLEHADLDHYTHIAKLDGDVVLPPNYFGEMCSRFRANPRLGIAGGAVTEWRDDHWWMMPTPENHVTPQARVYSRECFEAIGGMPPYMGADMITTFRAKAGGYETRTYPDLAYRHLRPMATADGVRRGRARQGTYQYLVHYGPVWVLLRSFVVAVRFRPYGLSGFWFLWGYLRAAVTRVPRVDDPLVRDYARAEQRRRMRAGARRLLKALTFRRPGAAPSRPGDGSAHTARSLSARTEDRAKQVS